MSWNHWALVGLLSCFASAALGQALAQEIANDSYRLKVEADGSLIVSRPDGASRRFEPQFTVLLTDTDPKPALRWGQFNEPKDRVLYNVMTWSTSGGKTDAAATTGGHVEDGFDPGSDRAADVGRTANLFRAAPATVVKAAAVPVEGRTVIWSFPEQSEFALAATVELPEGAAPPRLVVKLTPKVEKWFSVGYTGAPQAEPSAMDGMWQPMIWQEKRFPNAPFLTESYRSPIPTCLVASEGVTVGVVADPAELPFDPLPTLGNSRFGVAVRNAEGKAQPSLFAPILGHVDSKMPAGKPFEFAMRLFVAKAGVTDAYEQLARGLFGFRDYRRNSLCTLNQTLENTIDYAMSEYAHFNAELRGSSYDTDVPGAVKNVSALHPLGVALVTDDARVYHERARPMIEYAVSREKFLFTTNPAIKGQSASAKLLGPGVPLSEMAALYEMSRRRSGALLELAKGLFGRDRVLNLDARLPGDSWQNALALYRATGERQWLDKAISGADEYLARRVNTPQTDFSDPDSRGMFFWTSYAPHWAELLELYETTRQQRYLDAAREGARRFAQFAWMSPAIPAGEILVNKGNVAPSYRSAAKFKKIPIPEEMVPAWRMSEMGLTPESSGTCKGHRAVFLASHGPFMLRLGWLTGDSFLHDIGRSAVIGRSRSFPGYHINTARTSVYEKIDFPNRPLEELNSTTSLHYNHIWPHIAMQLDYLVSDAVARSRGAVDFPSHYAEGYAYLQSKVYGDRPGTFYGEKDVWLWMPKGLIRTDNVEVNYVAGRGNGKLYVALTNQSSEAVNVKLTFDDVLLPQLRQGGRTVKVWKDNEPAGAAQVENGTIAVPVAANGITGIAIEGVEVKPAFQDDVVAGETKPWSADHARFDVGNGYAMILNMGPSLTSAYVYLQANNEVFKQVRLSYRADGQEKSVDDSSYPFEYTVPLPAGAKTFEFSVRATGVDGTVQQGGWVVLRR